MNILVRAARPQRSGRVKPPSFRARLYGTTSRHSYRDYSGYEWMQYTMMHDLLRSRAVAAATRNSKIYGYVAWAPQRSG
ncbi:hypothetical protein VTO73DRAFT_87 [Trametes versicolor]